MRRLPADQLPRGTGVELKVLYRRCQELLKAWVPISRYSLKALERVTEFIEMNAMEKPKEQR